MNNSLTNQFISDTYESLLHVGLSAIPSGVVVDVNDGIGQKTSLSLGLSGNGATISGSLTAGNIGYPQVNTFIQFIDWLYPIGSVILSTENSNPSSRFSGTNWEQVSQGRVIVGEGTGTDENNTQKTFTVGNNLDGEYSHQLSNNELPDHYHYIANTDIDQNNSSFTTLNTDNFLAGARNSLPAFTVFDYRLNGTQTEATIGKTSGVVGNQSLTKINTTNPSYGVYIWKRIS